MGSTCPPLYPFCLLLVLPYFLLTHPCRERVMLLFFLFFLVVKLYVVFLLLPQYNFNFIIIITVLEEIGINNILLEHVS